MISRNRRGGGGVVAEFFSVLSGPRPDSVGEWGGGGSSRNCFRLSSVSRSHFYPTLSDIRG